MTHCEILDQFFSRSQEKILHQQLLEASDFVVPVEDVKNYMILVTEISYTECLNYLDNHPALGVYTSRDIAPCGTLKGCTDEWCQVLLKAGGSGMSIMEIGKSACYAKYLRVSKSESWSRCGNRQARAAQQLGLAFKHDHRWYLSAYGYVYAYSLLSKRQQRRFLSRALLRNPFYADVLRHIRSEELHLSSLMCGLSPASQGGRSASVVRLLQLCWDEMVSEGIKWHDLYVPKYNAKRKEVHEIVLPGTWNPVDNYAVNDDYFQGGIPLYTVKAACGYFVDHEVPEQEGWMDLSSCGIGTNSEDYFVVKAKGDSMLPKIKDGDLCLFKWYRGESLYNQIVLTQCRDYDEDYESSYTIKRFHYDEGWEGAPCQISLQPLNKSRYQPIVLSAEDGCDYKTIGLFVQVL